MGPSWLWWRIFSLFQEHGDPTEGLEVRVRGVIISVPPNTSEVAPFSVPIQWATSRPPAPGPACPSDSVLAFTVPIYNGITSPLLFRDPTHRCVDKETELRGGKESVHSGIPSRLGVVSEPHNCPFQLVLKVKLPPSTGLLRKKMYQ